jgi:hypothetical protein
LARSDDLRKVIPNSVTHAILQGDELRESLGKATGDRDRGLCIIVSSVER